MDALLFLSVVARWEVIVASLLLLVLLPLVTFLSIGRQPGHVPAARAAAPEKAGRRRSAAA